MAAWCWVSWMVSMCLAILISQVQTQTAEFWNNQAQDILKDAIRNAENLNRNVAKNVVLFVGAGMGPSTVTAARILKGQQAGKPGEEEVLAWEKFASLGLSKTYNTNKQVPDSAGTATAYLCGVKTKSEVVGVDNRIEHAKCPVDIDAISVDSVMKHAERAGKATGFVTTARVTHATPSCLYAHSPERYWEYDAEIPPEETGKGCIDIAQQLVTLAEKTRVILGGGRLYFLPDTVSDPEYTFMNGKRKDGRNLIEEWVASKDAEKSKYVWNLDDFNNVNTEQTEYLLGLFEGNHMQFEADRLTDEGGEPSIAEMTEKAIRIMQKDQDGFFLMVEGGRIDHGHHDGTAYNALHDTVAMERAVAKAMELTNEEDTLVIVTADHSHTMTMGGYPTRGNPILGLCDRCSDSNDLPFTTLQYANGPGGTAEQQSYLNTGKRRDLSNVDTQHPDFLAPATFNCEDESHSGEDVAIYANGPMSHLFHGVHEQNYIAHVIRYAACLDYTEHCDTERQVPPLSHRQPGACTGGSMPLAPPMTVWVFAVSLMSYLSFQ